MLQCVVVHCSVLQRACYLGKCRQCCSVLQCVAVCCSMYIMSVTVDSVAVRCTVLQRACYLGNCRQCCSVL